MTDETRQRIERLIPKGCTCLNCHALRAIHKRLTKRHAMVHDDLLELADDLSTLASPIVVTRPRRAK